MTKLKSRLCVICGEKYEPKRSNQKTCSKECSAVYSRQRYKYKTPPKKEITAAAWRRLKPCERWALMTLQEIAAECDRLHISYGKAQALKQCGRLPADFGKRSKGNE